MNHIHVSCSVCARHVRVSEVRCPFCGAAVTALPPLDYTDMMLGLRLTRAATLVLGAALMAGCQSGRDGPPTPTPDAGRASPPPNAPLYGLPPSLDAGPPPTVVVPHDAGAPPPDAPARSTPHAHRRPTRHRPESPNVPMYGIPPEE